MTVFNKLKGMKKKERENKLKDTREREREREPPSLSATEERQKGETDREDSETVKERALLKHAVTGKSYLQGQTC